MTTVEVNPDIPVEEWQSYVGSHPEGNYYHLPQWQEVIKESLNHRPFYLFAKNGEGELCGILPLFQIRSVLTGRRLVSLPFSHTCGPLADSEDTVRLLIDRAKSLCDELSCSYMEIRTMQPLSLGLEVNDHFFAHVLKLSEPRLMWQKTLDRNARWAVGKARREGVVVKSHDSTEAFEVFHAINLQTKRRLGVPGHHKDFFMAIRKHMKQYARLYLAELQNKFVAGALMINFNGVAGYAYAGSDSRYLKQCPNDLLAWQAIEDSYNNGFRSFDLGKTDPANVGLSHFKEKWGAEPQRLHFHYYPRAPVLVSSNRSGMKYRLVTSVWKRVPLPLVRVFSPTVFRQLD
jgi:serine/alanine adding enzyme